MTNIADKKVDMLDIICDPNSSQKEINQFASDDSEFIRYHVASFTTDVDILKTLSEDKSYNVRCYVAMNDYTPQDILFKLSKDENFTVRASIICNKNISEETLKYMIENDPDENLRMKARFELNSCLE